MSRSSERPKYPETSDWFSHWRYYSGPGNRPILVAVDRNNQKRSARHLDVKSNSFCFKDGLLTGVEWGLDYDEVDEAEFNRLIDGQIADYHEAARKAREAGKPWPPVRTKATHVLAEKPADPAYVKLQHRGSWIVDARLRENGDLAFCSGDTHREWYAIVPAARVEDLRSALVDKLGPDAPGTVLDLIKSRFSAPEDAPNPFEEIKAFLTRSGIAWVHDVW